MAQVTKQTTIGEMLRIDPNIAAILMRAVCTASAARPHRVSPWKRLALYMALTLIS